MKKLNKITEVAIAVEDIALTTRLLVDLLGGEASEITRVPQFGMQYRMVKLGNVEFELMEPIDENGIIAKFIEERGEGLHHVAFAVDDLSETFNFLKEHGCKMVTEEPLELLGAKVLFTHPKFFSGVMFELIEYPKEWIFPDGEINK